MEYNDYNTEKEPLILKEYGRNIQRLVRHLLTIEDKDKRTRFANTMVELLKQINGSLRYYPELNQKLWDDLYIISDFKLEVDSPFPKPKRSVLTRKPETIKYKYRKTKFKHYGYNIQLLVEKAIEIDDPIKREEAVIYLGRLMRSFYASWNRELADESVILKNIRELSDNQLDIDIQKVKDNNLFETFYKDKNRNQKGRSSGSTNRYGSTNRSGSTNRPGSSNRSGSSNRRRKN